MIKKKNTHTQELIAPFPEKDPATFAVAFPSLHEMHLELST